MTAPDAAAPGRRGARGRDGRRAGVGERGQPRALPRGARARLEPPRHARHADARPAAPPRASSDPARLARPAAAAPRWTTRCATATRRSPGRSRAATPAPSRRTCARSARSRPRRCAAYVALARVTADRALAAGTAARRRRPRRCSTSWRRDRRRTADDVGDRSSARARASRSALRRLVPRRHASRRGAHDGRAARAGTRTLVARGRAPASASTVTSRSRSSSTRLQFAPGEDLARYPRTLDADLALCARRGRRPGVRPVARRRLPRRRARTVTRRSAARSATLLEGAVAARPLRRRAHRGRQAASPRSGPTSRVLRREGLPAADARSGGWSRDLDLPVRDRRACRPCASRTGSRCRAATSTCPTPTARARARAVPRAGRRRATRRAGGGAAACARRGRACWPPSPASTSTTCVLARPRARCRRRSSGAAGCSSPRGSARTRLIDNVALRSGAAAMTLPTAAPARARPRRAGPRDRRRGRRLRHRRAHRPRCTRRAAPATACCW